MPFLFVGVDKYVGSIALYGQADVVQGLPSTLHEFYAAVVGIPGELFVEFALEMKQRTRQEKDRALVVAAFTNDYIGYIITPRAEYTGGYEQAVSLVNEQAGRALTEASMRLVDEFVK